jgi:hypothetical protein
MLILIITKRFLDMIKAQHTLSSNRQYFARSRRILSI